MPKDVPKIDPFHLPRKKLKDRLSVTCAVSEGDLPMEVYWSKDGKKISEEDAVINIQV